MLLSLRSRNHEIKSVLEKIMVSFDGTGGGHPHACGANVS
jgi:nanoRNase/pAp phosphatase (c-di-AMP/oligoRNAs hydrolase)